MSFWDTEIAKARIARTTPADEAPLNVTMLMIEGPVWLKTSTPVGELFPAKPDGAPIICFLGDSAEKTSNSNSESIQRQLADAPGRMSRMLPLFFAEQVEFMTEAHVQTLVPWISNGSGGFVLSGVAWSDEDAAKYSRQAQVKSDYVVTIHLRTQAEPWDVRLRLVSVMDGRCIGDLKAAFPFNKPEEAIPELARRLVGLLNQGAGMNSQAAPPLYQVPGGANFPYYLLRLEQLLAVRCGSLGGAQATFLSGEREILDGNLNLCLACQDNVVSRILLMQTLLAMKKVRPDIVSEFNDKAALLQVEKPLLEPAQSVLKRLMTEISAA